MADEDRRASSRSAGTRSRRSILLQTLDHHWKEHLATLDALRQVIHLRSYAQKKPIDEYKQEAFLLFERLLVAIREEVTRVLMRAQVQLEAAAAAGAARLHHAAHRSVLGRRRHAPTSMRRRGAMLSSLPPLNIPQPAAAAAARMASVVEAPVSRNAPCPCGSGRKYKHCHGQLA